jgi:predicted dienelactone hydrolase
MTLRLIRLGAVMAWSFAAALSLTSPTAARAPSIPSIDAPELAHLGQYAVGLKRFDLTQPGQADLTKLDPKTGVAPVSDRVLPISLWYPAQASPGAQPVSYSAGLTPEKPDQAPVPVRAEGIAVLDAAPVKGQRFPLVILSHGYGGAPEAMTWVAENLASKGYVVAAISHRDPPYGDPRGFLGPVLRRSLDQAFVARTLLARIKGGDAVLAGLVDSDRVALIGYSMGGYGVLTEAIGGFDPAGAPAHMLPSPYIGPYLPAGDRRGEEPIPGLKAVVAISPFTGLPGAPAFSPATLGAIQTPLLLIVGDRDHTVGFAGVKNVFDQAVHAPRRLLVFREGDHNIGMNPATLGDENSLWALDWFEDPVWRKDRTIGVSLHMITAFLDRYVKGDESKAAYLDPAVPRSDDGVWPADKAGAYDAYSSGAAPITAWKGFQRGHSSGLELLRGDPAP